MSVEGSLFSALRSEADYVAETIDLQRNGPTSFHGPSSDMLQSGHTLRANLGIAPEIRFGEVVDSVGYAHCYRVILEQGRPPIPCTALVDSSLRPVGVKTINTLMPGTMVVVIRHPQRPIGWIIGVVPSVMVSADRVLSDVIHMAGRCGISVDKAHRAIFQARKKGGVTDYSSGRPRDTLSIGEWGGIAETGLKCLLDSFMAQFGLDEFTGLSVFYHDMLARLGGYNLQIRSHAHELDILNDQGETHWYDGSTPYPWEAVGALQPGIDPFRELGARQWKIDEPHYGKWEPRSDNQQPFHRRVVHLGYVGQGGKVQVIAPPEEGDVNVYGPGSSASHALFEEQVSLTGRSMTRSATGIHIRKYPIIPSPKRLRRPEDKGGDDEANYKFAGIQGGGVAHKVGMFEFTDANTLLQRATALWDIHAHCFNWEGFHAFHYHAKDWDTPEESASKFAADMALPRVVDLAKRQFMGPPKKVSYKVDHRYGTVDFYLNDAGIVLMDDGGVVVYDGFGSTLTMTAGNVFLDTPGDLTVRTGRNFNVFAGRDVCVRAHNSIDASTAKKDIRLKAEQHLQMMAGNNGKGAVLIESKGEADPDEEFDYANKIGEDVIASGIHIKAAHAPIVSLSKSVYVRTGGGDVESGPIVFDADKGNGDIITTSDNFVRKIRSQALDCFPSSSNVFSEYQNVIGGAFGVKGGLTVASFGFFGESVIVMGGHIFTELAPQYANLVGQLAAESLDPNRQAIAESTDTTAVDEACSDVQDALDERYYDENRPGHDDTIRSIQFSFRNQVQYKTTDWKTWEARWQQILRATSDGEPVVWVEPPVPAGSEKTYPYPGKEAWTARESLYEQDCELFDVDKGTAKDRGSDAEKYEKPKLKKPVSRKPEGNYLILIP